MFSLACSPPIQLVALINHQISFCCHCEYYCKAGSGKIGHGPPNLITCIFLLNLIYSNRALALLNFSFQPQILPDSSLHCWFFVGYAHRPLPQPAVYLICFHCMVTESLAEDGPPSLCLSELAPLQLVTHNEGSIGHSLVASCSLWLSLRTIQHITVVKHLTAGTVIDHQKLVALGSLSLSVSKIKPVTYT